MTTTARKLLHTANTLSRVNVQQKHRNTMAIISSSYKTNGTVDLVTANSVQAVDTSDMEATLKKKYAPTEVRFQAPFGHLAGLEWGRRESPNKILCIHGWLDNAGSFERLIPFILNHNEDYHIVAPDLPGVGLSSHRPVGSEYSTLSNIVEIRRITQQLGWDSNLTLLSHSLGSHFAYIYSCIYSSQVSTMIALDTVQPLTRPTTNWATLMGNIIEDAFKSENSHQNSTTTKGVVPVYTEEEALKRLMDAHRSSLTRESAMTLMKRGAKKEWGYTFNRDIRHRHMSVEIRPDDELMLKYLNEAFKPNLLIIRASESLYQRPDTIRMKYYDLFKRKCKIFCDTLVDGTHHVHMNSPDVVAVEINKFLDLLASENAKELSTLKANL